MKNALYILFIVVVGAVFYTLTLRGVYGNPDQNAIKNNLDRATKPFELSPERGRYALVASLAENHSFALSQTLADAVYPDVGYYQGRFYTYFVPGISLLALPFYMIGAHYNLAQVFSFSVIPIITILTLIFLFKIAYDIFKLPLWMSLFAPFVFAFASTSWSYAITLYQHQVTTFFIISSFYAVWKYKQKTAWSSLWAILVWFNYGYAIFIDYPNVILMLPIIIYFLITSFEKIQQNGVIKVSFRLAFVYSSLFFILLTIMHGYYNYTQFGDWKRLSGSLLGYKAIKEQHLFETANTKKIAQFENAKQPLNFFKEDLLPNGMYTLIASTDRGILFYSPIFLLALLGIFSTLSKLNLETGVLISIILVNFCVYASFGDPWGGWAFGPRYLIPSMAVLSLFVVLWLSNIKFTIHSKILAFFYFIYSSAIALLGALTSNAVPPKIEADYLGMKYNFLLNVDYLKSQQSGSFIYNNFLSHTISLTEYFFIIHAGITIIVFIILFILPLAKEVNQDEH